MENKHVSNMTYVGDACYLFLSNNQAEKIIL